VTRVPYPTRPRLLVACHVTPYPPADGGRIRAFEVLRRLASAFDVETVSCSDHDEHEAVDALAAYDVRATVVPRLSRPAAAAAALSARRSFASAFCASPVMDRLVAQRLAAHDADLVLTTSTLVSRVAQRRSVPWVLDAHNLESVLVERLAASPGRLAPYRAYARRETTLRRVEEMAAWTSATSILTMSSDDRDHVLARAPRSRVVLAPNGVDASRFAALPPSPASGHLLFVGKLDYRPNADGIRWFCDDVFPRIRAARPQARLRIVGANAPAAVTGLGARPGIEVVGAVDDVADELAGAAVCLVPLHAGSGTRLKVLEAFAAHRPVVSTTIGVEGVPARHGEHLLVADTAGDFANAVLRVLTSETLRSSLTGHAAGLAAGFDWDRAAQTTASELDYALSTAVPR
jgi:glycosyltransferase involved in cell wall biosynthesis